MKTIVTATAVGLAVLAIAAPTPVAAPEAAPTLAQFNALKKRVTKAEARLLSLELDVDCMDDVAYPVKQYGSSSGSQGYWYRDSQGTEFLTTALDEPEASDAPDAWLAEVNEDCVDGSPTGRWARAADSGGAGR